MLENLICTQYERNFAQNLQDCLVIGKLAAKKYEEGMSFGDEKDVIMPGRVTMSDWAGGDLNTVEKVRSSIVKVKVDQGKQVAAEKLDAAKQGIKTGYQKATEYLEKERERERIRKEEINQKITETVTNAAQDAKEKVENSSLGQKYQREKWLWENQHNSDDSSN